MMSTWVREWIAGYGADPEAIRRAYLALGMSDDDYAAAVVRGFPPRVFSGDGTL